MVYRTSMAAALLIVASGLSTSNAQSTLYWDTNGTTAGATVGGFADGDWDTATANWNPVANGTGTPITWTAGDHAVFSAGSDVTNDPDEGGIVLVDGTQVASSVLFEEGYYQIRGGTLDHGTGTVTINAGATMDINSTIRLNLAGGRILLDGGTLLGTNPGSAGSFVGTGPGEKTIEVDGIGFIGYDDLDGTPDNKVSIFWGVIEGTGGTTTNGGAGTLVKIGPDQLGIAVSDQGGTHSQELFTFAKLEVREGAYRLRQHGSSDMTVRETAFGAVPLAVLPDAIKLDGGGIGSNTTVTLHENRGITVGSSGGYLDHGAGAGLVIPGPVTAAPGNTLTIGSPTSTSVANVTFALSNTNNVNTFQGDVHVRRGVLQLDSSLNAANFSGAGLDATNVGTVNVADGQTFTFGSGGNNTSYDGLVAGAGTFRKVGAGTTTFTGTGHTHSGDTVIDAGTLSITEAYLADAADVFLTTGALLNLNFNATDTIDQLFFDNTAQDAGIYGAIGSGAANETAFLTGMGLLDVTTGASVGLVGDYNNDGKVDAADYVVWRKTNINGQQGYDDWRDNFGAMAMPGGGSGVQASAVPEPATVGLLLLGVAGVLARRRTR